jgi:predicted nucleic acid-binding protein
LADKFFLDTNVLLSAFSPDRAKAAVADELVERAIDARSGVISYQVVQEALNVLVSRGTVVLQSDEAREYFERILRPLLAIGSSPALVLEALWLRERYGLAWYDALIVAAAIEADCEVLYSEDFQAGMRFGKLRVVNPFAE